MATSSADPLAQDSDPEAILRHLHAVPPPRTARSRAPEAGSAADGPGIWDPPQGRAPQRTPFTFADPPPALKMLQTAKAIGGIVMTRILLLLVLLCAGGLWSLTVYDPQFYRIVASAIFSAMVLWPLCWVVSRRG